MTLPIIKRYLIAVSKYKWFGLAAFVAVCSASGVYAIKPEKPDSFLAEGYLAANQSIVVFSSTGDETQKQAPKITEEFLLSPEVLRVVASQTKQKPEEIYENSAILMPEENKLQEIRVHYKSLNEEQAKATVEALVKAMVNYSRSINTTRVRAIMQEINQRLPQVDAELKAAEKNLQEFDQVEGAFLSVARIGALPNAIASSQEQQRQLQMALEGYDAQIRSLSGRLGLTAAQAYVSQALSADPIINDLRAQMYQNESQIEIFRRDLRGSHPTMVELVKKQQALEELLQQRYAEVIGGNGMAAPLMNGAEIRQNSSLDPARQQLASRLIAFQTEREKLQQQLEASMRSEQELRREYATIPNKQLERTRLEGQLGIKKALYDKMQAALADAKAAEAEIVSSVRIVPKPLKVINTKKPNPKMALVLAGGGLLGLGIGGALIFLLSVLDGKFYTMEEVRAALQEKDLPLLGVLPIVEGYDPERSEMPALVERDSVYLEAYERLRTNLRRTGEKPVKVLLLTSAGRREGKTFVAYNLAIASARAGKRTLLIEADLRSPSQSQYLKISTDPENSIEPLRYYGQPNNCIRLVPEIENLYVVPSPGPVRQAGAILESSEMLRLLKEVRGRFDFVILDAPSLSAGNDAFLLEPYTDGMAIVTRPLYSQPGMLSEYVDPLTESEDIRLLGAIVNGADIPVEIYSRSPIPEPADYMPPPPPEPVEEEIQPLESPRSEVPTSSRF